MPKNFWSIFLNSLFPEECLSCGQGHGLLCPNCAAKLPRLNQVDYPLIPNLDQVISLFAYPELAKILPAYKYQGLTNLAKPLAELLADYFINHFNEVSEVIIIPLPSHARRIRERGFDHITLITDELAKLTHQLSANNILIRTKYTPHQVKLNRAERLINLKNCFSLIKPELITNKTVILVDDVTTTGASLQEAAKTLRTAKPKKIIGLVLAYEQLSPLNPTSLIKSE